MADPEAEAKAKLEDGILEAPLTGGVESGVTHEQVRVWSSMTFPNHTSQVLSLHSHIFNRVQ